MKKGLVIGFVFVLVMIGVVSATIYGNTYVDASLGEEFSIGELSCEHTLIFKEYHSDTMEIVLEDKDTGQLKTYDYDSSLGGGWGDCGNARIINISYGGFEYKTFVCYNFAKISVRDRYPMCLNDPRYIEEEETFTLGGEECQKQFKYSESTGAPVIYEEPNWEESDFTLSGIIYSEENNPEWGANDVLGLIISLGDGNYHSLKRLRNYNMLFVYQEDEECPCVESWSCGSWTSCTNSQQTRSCTDSNSCGTTVNKPSTSQSCTVGTCSEDWDCTNWGECTNSQQTRTCTDSNSCGTTTNKPSESQACTTQPQQSEEEQEQNQEQEQETTTQETKYYIQNREVIIEKNVGGKNIITVEEKTIETTLEILESDSKIYVKTSGGNIEVKILPEDAISKANKITDVEEITIKQEKREVVYAILGTKKVRLFFIFPMSAEVRQDINVEDGEIVSTKRPWWHIFALGI